MALLEVCTQHRQKHRVPFISDHFQAQELSLRLWPTRKFAHNTDKNTRCFSSLIIFRHRNCHNGTTPPPPPPPPPQQMTCKLSLKLERWGSGCGRDCLSKSKNGEWGCAGIKIIKIFSKFRPNLIRPNSTLIHSPNVRCIRYCCHTFCLALLMTSVIWTVGQKVTALTNCVFLTFQC